VLATLDDGLLMVGHPQSTGNTFRVVLEVTALDDVLKMRHSSIDAAK
jgi:hypothetical protein